MSSSDFTLGPDDRIVFHGTSVAFEEFEESKIGSGGDSNSALGFHFAENPDDAVEYAEAAGARHGCKGTVLVVLLTTENPANHLNYYEFFGYDEAGNDIVGKAGFAKLRLEFLKAGFDSIDYEDGEQTIVVGLDARKTFVLAALDVKEATKLGKMMQALEEPDDNADRLRLVKEILAARPTQSWSVQP